MKKLLLLALVFVPLAPAVAYTWNIFNTTDGNVWVKLVRRGTLTSADNRLGKVIPPKQSATIDTQLAYCVIGVVAVGQSDTVAGLSKEQPMSLTCGDRNVFINHIKKQYSQPTGGGVSVVTGGTATTTNQPTLIPGSGELQIQVT